MSFKFSFPKISFRTNSSTAITSGRVGTMPTIRDTERLCCQAVPSRKGSCQLGETSNGGSVLDSDGGRIHEQVEQAQAKISLIK